MSESNPLTKRHYGIFRGAPGRPMPAEASAAYDEARRRKARRDRTKGVEIDDFAPGDVVVIKHHGGLKSSGRTIYGLAEVVDVHTLLTHRWRDRGGSVTVRVLHSEAPEYAGHYFGMSTEDRYGYYWAATCFAPELSHEEYHRRFLGGA